MTIQERIEQAETSEGSDVYIFDGEDLWHLLKQVAKEQRELCAKEIEDEEGTPYEQVIESVKYLILIAPSPMETTDE